MASLELFLSQPNIFRLKTLVFLRLRLVAMQIVHNSYAKNK